MHGSLGFTTQLQGQSSRIRVITILRRSWARSHIYFSFYWCNLFAFFVHFGPPWFHCLCIKVFIFKMRMYLFCNLQKFLYMNMNFNRLPWPHYYIMFSGKMTYSWWQHDIGKSPVDMCWNSCNEFCVDHDYFIAIGSLLPWQHKQKQHYYRILSYM